MFNIEKISLSDCKFKHFFIYFFGHKYSMDSKVMQTISDEDSHQELGISILEV